jgi:hypothetical protein
LSPGPEPDEDILSYTCSPTLSEILARTTGKKRTQGFLEGIKIRKELTLFLFLGNMTTYVELLSQINIKIYITKD